jgi:hypothetical protein
VARVRESIDTTTATGRFFLSMIGAIHQMERELRAERAAYLVGVSNMISVGNAYDQKNDWEEGKTFVRQAARGLSGTTVAEAVRRVNEWYAANPDRMEVAVLSVLWLDIVNPRIEP